MLKQALCEAKTPTEVGEIRHTAKDAYFSRVMSKGVFKLLQRRCNLKTMELMNKY